MTIGHTSAVIRNLHRAALLPDGGELTDGQLLERFLGRGEEAAFEVLVRRHGPMVMGVCRRVLGNAHDAEDAFQATFLVFVRKAASMTSRAVVGNWLYGVAYRTALKTRVAMHRQRVKERAMAKPAAIEERNCSDSLQRLDEELNRLPDKYRELIVLCDLEGKTRKDAARRLGLPEGTVAGRLARARVQLAKRLSQEGFAISGGTLAVLLSENASACVPTWVVASTTKAASLSATGQMAITGLVSAKVAALTEGVLKTMLLTKLKIATALVLAAGFLAGVGICACQGLAEKAPTQEDRRSSSPKPIGEPRAQTPKANTSWREWASLQGHTDQVNAVAISPDRKTLASAGQDSTVVLWDLATRKARATLRGHKQPVSCLSFTPDGQLVASGSFGSDDEKMSQVGQVILWDADTGKERGTFKLGENGGPVYSVTFSPDGKLLAASGDLGRTPGPADEDKSFGVVTLWDVSTGKERVTLKAQFASHGDSLAFLPLNSLVFSPNSKTLAMVSEGKVKLWDWSTQKEVLALEETEKSENPGGPQPVFLHVAISPDGQTLATMHAQQGVKLWDAKTGKEKARLPKRQGEGWWPSSSLDFSQDGKTLITVNNQNLEKDKFHVSRGEVSLWNAATGKLLKRLPLETYVTSFSISRDGKMLAAGCRGDVKVSTEPPSTEDIAARKDLRIGDKRGVVRIWTLEP